MSVGWILPFKDVWPRLENSPVSESRNLFLTSFQVFIALWKRRHLSNISKAWQDSGSSLRVNLAPQGGGDVCTILFLQSNGNEAGVAIVWPPPVAEQSLLVCGRGIYSEPLGLSTKLRQGLRMKRTLAPGNKKEIKCNSELIALF